VSAGLSDLAGELVGGPAAGIALEAALTMVYTFEYLAGTGAGCVREHKLGYCVEEHLCL